jgi:hypothetical protein
VQALCDTHLSKGAIKKVKIFETYLPSPYNVRKVPIGEDFAQ